AHDRPPLTRDGLRSVRRHLRPGRLRPPAEPRPRYGTDRATVERHLDVRRLRQRGGRTLYGDAPQRVAGRSRAGPRAERVDERPPRHPHDDVENALRRHAANVAHGTDGLGEAVASRAVPYAAFA